MFESAIPGEKADLCPFGRIAYWTGSTPEDVETHLVEGDLSPVDVPEQGGPHIGIEWDEPRRVSSLVVRWAEGLPFPRPGSISIQYWHRSWPQHGSSGWNAIDDLYNGKWVTAETSAVEIDSGLVFSFLPLERKELDVEGIEPVTYRLAMRFRLLFCSDGDQPQIESMQTLGDFSWKRVPVTVQFGCVPGVSVPETGVLEVTNGYGESGDQHSSPCSGLEWGLPDTYDLRFDAIVIDVGDTADRTICTVRTEPFSFSFIPAELNASPIFAPDLGVFISDGIGYDEWARSAETRGKCVYDRVIDEPEQSYERASSEIPQLIKSRQDSTGRYVPLGCEGNRQEIAVHYTGDVYIEWSALKSSPTPQEPLLWPGTRNSWQRSIRYRILSGESMATRDGDSDTQQEILDGYLPIVISRWEHEGISYREESLAALLDGSQWNEADQQGDETTVLLNRITLSNTLGEPRTAKLWITMDHPEQLEVEDGFAVATADLRPDEEAGDRTIYDEPRLRFYLDKRGRGDIHVTSTSEWPSVVGYSVELQPNESHDIDLRVPFVTFTGRQGREEIALLDHEVKRPETIEYWRSVVDSGAEIRTPEPLINDFNRAQITHVAITADKDPLTGLVMLPAGTYRYAVCANESVHQIRSLDLRGHHERAERYLEPFLKLQGTRNLHGRFRDADGALHGLRVSEDLDYQTFAYNLDHGFVLWMLGEHWKLTRNKSWAERIAPNIVAACDFVTRERQATKTTDSSGHRVWEYGLLPPGHLEDPPEFHYWFAVNAYAARGMVESAQMLAEIGNPEADRIRRDTEAFMDDLRAAAEESMVRAPTAKLRDGTSVPFQPTRCLLRGRDWGWIREGLYGPIHLIDCGVYNFDSPEATWILKDSEDNVFIDPVRGRRLGDFEKDWFSQGGITIQSNLLPNPLVYLRRGQPEHAIRAFYNSMAANLYPDVRVFCEHPVEAYGVGAGPFFKSPDESAWIVWLRHLLLMEDGDALHIMPGAPRKWFEDGKEIALRDMPTYFGPVELCVKSETEAGKLVAKIRPPKRNPPAALKVHFRHPEKSSICSVLVNGHLYGDFERSGVVRFPNARSLPKELEIVCHY